MFKIGVGPSSSHTMGPWRAAQRFVAELAGRSAGVTGLTVDLYGSLAKTGKGHGTDIAVQLGLCGYDPVTIEFDEIGACVQRLADSHQLNLHGRNVKFDAKSCIHFHFNQQLPGHPNALQFTATSSSGVVHQAIYYSVGGGFVTKEGETEDDTASAPVPLPVNTAADLLGHCESQSLRICEVVLKNEQTWRTAAKVRSGLNHIRQVMLNSIHRGCCTSGELPGGLHVQRRAARTAHKLLGGAPPPHCDDWAAALCQQPRDFQCVLDWVSCFALAVNEENAAFGRVVTAPTNGAAGVIPAVLMYFESFCDATEDASINFLLTAAQIGCIFKTGATISAAMGGCQAEIGVSSAMAAAALCEALGGSPRQAAVAAEIAMEHHLGMTCDPVGGLVQIPCIERNAMGAVKAISAARISLQRDPLEARVSLDDVVRTMWNTAQDMNAKYKETSDGGLAVQISVNLSEC